MPTNDYELIYLIKTHSDEKALELMIGKYQNLIWKMIHLFNVQSKDQDDFYQEALILLVETVYSFNEQKNKTFTRYFELVLKRRFIRLKSKLPGWTLYEKVELIEDKMQPFESVLMEIPELTEQEAVMFDYYYVKHYTTENIVTSTGLSKKQVYNSLYRLKQRLKKYNYIIKY